MTEKLTAREDHLAEILAAVDPLAALNVILARDIEGMEEDAKLVCERCRDEGPPKSNQTLHSWHHGESKVSGEVDFCYAMDIHDRIAELRKEPKTSGGT